MLSLPRKTLISCGFLPHGVGACQRGGKSSSPPSRTNENGSRKGPFSFVWASLARYGFAVRGGDVADIAFADDPVTTEHGERLGSILLGRGRTAHAGVRSDATWAST